MTILPDAHALASVYKLSLPLQSRALDERVYQISTNGGAYALKLYSPDASLDQQRYEHWLLLSLAAMDLSFAVPCPLRDEGGATFHKAENGDIWVLSPLLSGQQISPNDLDQAYAVGAALGELHAALARLHPILRPHDEAYNPQERILPHLRQTQAADLSAFGLQNTSENQHRLSRLMNLADDLRLPPPQPSRDLPWQIVHGEFFGQNLLYDADLAKVTGVLDFEYARPDYRARDFADTLMHIGSDLDELFWALARAFVDGYSLSLNLTRAEIEMMPRFMVESQVNRIFGYVRAQQPVHAGQALRVQEETSAWLELESERLQNMLRGLFLNEEFDIDK